MMDPFVEQLTQEQAIALAESGIWKDWDDEKIVRMQLFQERLFVDFGDFHEALEHVLGRPVWTHELGLNYKGIVKEYLGLRPPPTMQEIMDLIPAEKRIIVDGEE